MPYPTPMRTPVRYSGPQTRSMARSVAGAAIRGAMSLNPYGAAAVRAASVIQRGYRAYRTYKSYQQRKSPGVAGPRRLLQFGGRGGGKFSRPSKKGKVDIAKKLGAKLSYEVYGKCTDPDMVVIGHNTYPVRIICEGIVFAILRKAFKKAINFDAQDVNQEIPAQWYNESTGCEVVFIWKDASTGTITVTQVTLANNDTISSVANKPTTGDSTDSFVTQIYNKFDNETTWNSRELERVIVRGPSSPNIVLCDLNMVNEVITLQVSSQLKCQNRTFAAESVDEVGITSTDRVDTQPLIGKSLLLTGVPKLKSGHIPLGLFSPSNTFIGSMVLIRGAELPAGNQGQPYTKQDFTNAYAESKINLQPGDIKSSYIKMYKRSYFNNFLRSIKMVTGSDKVVQAPGKTNLLFFEEQLNSGSANNITVSYEQQLFISCYLVTGRSTAINTAHSQSNYSNVTPLPP